MKRIRRLLYPQSPNGVWTPLFAAVILMSIAALTLAAMQAAPAQQSADAAQKQTERAVTPYVKWLNEDVVYIIDDKERAAFEKVTTDEERNKFIEQFWLRREMPGTSPEKVKQEHYRRIAYANEHFRTTSGRPGWETDRGHMYIVYGPPDEIESHPSGETRTPHPFEDWKYYHVEGIGDNLFVKFVDRTRTGDFRVAPGDGH